MRPSKATGSSKDSPGQIDFDADRHLKPIPALRRLLDEGEFEDAQFELLEIRSTAAGELTWRQTAPRAEEAVIGYLGPV